MNILKRLSTVAFALFAFEVANAQEDGLISTQSLPTSVQTFINQDFPTNNIVSVWQGNEKGRVEDYTMLFADDTEVEFHANGDWKEVEARSGAAPTKVVPAKISKYTHKNYPNVLIKETQEEGRKYEISPSSGLNLDFNLDDRFLKIDN